MAKVCKCGADLTKNNKGVVAWARVGYLSHGCFMHGNFVAMSNDGGCEQVTYTCVACGEEVKP